jgi:hypothetical protein
MPPPSSSFFLFGPRGVGKTVWCRSHFPDSVYLDCWAHLLSIEDALKTLQKLL